MLTSKEKSHNFSGGVPISITPLFGSGHNAMVTPADIARLCSGLGDPSSESLCRQSFTGCEDSWTSEPARSSCTALTTACAEQRKAGKSTFELAMPSGGKLELPSVEACFQTAERITKAFWPTAYREPPPDRHPPPPDYPPPDPPPPPAGAAHCKDADDSDTPEFAKRQEFDTTHAALCQDWVDACSAQAASGEKPKKKYVLESPIGRRTFDDLAACQNGAVQLAREAQLFRNRQKEKKSAKGAREISLLVRGQIDFDKQSERYSLSSLATRSPLEGTIFYEAFAEQPVPRWSPCIRARYTFKKREAQDVLVRDGMVDWESEVKAHRGRGSFLMQLPIADDVVKIEIFFVPQEPIFDCSCSALKNVKPAIVLENGWENVTSDCKGKKSRIWVEACREWAERARPQNAWHTVIPLTPCRK